MLTPIRVIQNPILGPSVSARELFKLTTESQAQRDTFVDRFRHNQEKLKLVEGKDFIETTSVVPEKHPIKRFLEFIVSTEAAKKIAAIQTKGRGRGVVAFLDAYDLGLQASPEPQPAITEQAYLQETTLFAQHSPAPTPPQPVLEKSVEGTDVSIRLAALERNIGAIMRLFQPAAIGLDSGPAIESEPEPAPRVETTRSKLVRLVDLYEMAQLTSKKPITHQRIWNMLYAHLSFKYGFDAYAMGEGKKNPNYLDIAEEADQVGNLYAIAQDLLTVE